MRRVDDGGSSDRDFRDLRGEEEDVDDVDDEEDEDAFVLTDSILAPAK